MQTIVTGLTVSPIVFAGIVLLIEVTPIKDAAAGLLTTICLVVGLLGLALHRPLGRFMQWQSLKALQDRDDDPAALGGVYMSSMLISLSLTEGAAFFNLIGYMATREPLCLGMAALLVLVNLVNFPTLDRVEHWAREEARLFRDQKSLEE